MKATDTADQLAALKASEGLMETIRRKRSRTARNKAVNAVIAAYQNKKEVHHEEAKKLRRRSGAA